MVDPRDLDAIQELNQILHVIVLQAMERARAILTVEAMQVLREREAELNAQIGLILAQGVPINRPRLDRVVADARGLQERLATSRDVTELNQILGDTINLTQGLVKRARESPGGGGSRDWP